MTADINPECTCKKCGALVGMDRMYCDYCLNYKTRKRLVTVKIEYDLDKRPEGCNFLGAVMDMVKKQIEVSLPFVKVLGLTDEPNNER